MSNAATHHLDLSPAEVYGLQRGGQIIDLVDVRTAGEYDSLHADGARSVPLGTLSPQSVMAGRRGSPDRPLYVICQSGGRSQTACDRLAAAGIKVVNVKGGTSAWKRAGLPVVRSTSGSGGLPPILRLGALALALVMLILGFTVHPAFLFAAGVVWFTLVIINRGCPLGSCAIDPRGGSASDPPNRNDSSKGTNHANV
jgi:rhodanese-related sulfurtransferase